MTPEQQKSFEEAARPLIKWLCENVHPHHTAIVTPTNAELLEGECSTGTIMDYVRDWQLTPELSRRCTAAVGLSELLDRKTIRRGNENLEMAD